MEHQQSFAPTSGGAGGAELDMDEPHKPTVNRYELAAALIDYDEPLVAEEGVPTQRAFHSAILSPFRHILSRPPRPGIDETTSPPPPAIAPRSSAFSPEHQQYARRASVSRSSSEGAGSAGRTSLDFGRRTSIGDDLHSRYARTLAGYQTGPGEGHGGEQELGDSEKPFSMQEEEEEERLVEQWGLGEVMTKLASPTLSTDSWSQITPAESTIPFPSSSPLPSETFSSPLQPLSRRLSNSSDNEQRERTGPSFHIIERPSIEGGRALSLDSRSALNLPAFETLHIGGLERKRPTIDRPSSSLSYSRPSSAPGFRPPGRTRHISGGSIADTLARPPPSIGIDVGPSTSPAPRPSTSNSDDRPGSSFAMAPTAFTSRFDPAMLAIARQEIENERPVFQNKTAGLPPSTLLMPTPLSGRPLSPPPIMRHEGPDTDSEAADEPESDVLRDENGEIIEQRSQRPPGALYGRSLLDVLHERKAAAKSHQRHHNPAEDSRRPMADRGVSSASAPTSTTVPDPTAPALPRSTSVFGPDLFYQRDMERRREMDRAEALEREEEDRKEAEVWEKVRLKQENKALKRKKRDEAARKLEGLPSSEELRQPSEIVVRESGIPYRPKHTIAPSLSLPTGLDIQAGETSGWFAPPPPPSASSSSSDEEDWAARPTVKSKPTPRPANASYQSDDHTMRLREAVMHGTISASEAMAESHRLGLGTQSSGSQGRDERPLGERLSFQFESSAPPQLNVDLHGQGLNMTIAEKAELDGLGGGHTQASFSPEQIHAGSDDDDQPLGLRLRTLRGGDHASRPREDVDEDDIPLGLRRQSHLRSMAEQQDEDDRPLGLSLPSYQSQQNVALPYTQQSQPGFVQPEEHHQSMMYLQAQMQVQQQAALMNQHQSSLTGQMSFGNASGVDMGDVFQPGFGGAASQVERWRRGIV